MIEVDRRERQLTKLRYGKSMPPNVNAHWWTQCFCGASGSEYCPPTAGTRSITILQLAPAQAQKKNNIVWKTEETILPKIATTTVSCQQFKKGFELCSTKTARSTISCATLLSATTSVFCPFPHPLVPIHALDMGYLAGQSVPSFHQRLIFLVHTTYWNFHRSQWLDPESLIFNCQQGKDARKVIVKLTTEHTHTHS